MSGRARRLAVAACAATALLAASCAPADNAGRNPQPNGSREVLRTGHWRGAVQSTRVDFYVDRIAPGDVAIHVNGGLISTTLKDSPEHPIAFTDRPTTCKRKPDGRSFDCLRYKDMHVDNGFLCGVYQLYGQTLRPCFAPVR
jgi:hypothetical protein